MKTFMRFLYIILLILLQKVVVSAQTASVNADSFSIVSPVSYKLPPSYEDIDFLPINYDKLKQKFGNSKYTWVVTWASWCMVCQKSLGKYPWIVDSLLDKNIQLIVVLQDDDSTKARKILYASRMGFQTYHLDAETYGEEETSRLLKFRNEFCKDCKRIPMVTPHHFFFDQKGELLFHRVGTEIDRKFILDQITPKPTKAQIKKAAKEKAKKEKKAAKIKAKKQK